MFVMNFCRPISCSIFASLIVFSSCLHAQTLTPDDAALVVLNTGKRAFNDSQFPVAVERFREFLRVAPNHKDAATARYALGLALLETGDPKGALEALTPASTVEFPERPQALYHVGAAQRLTGIQTLAQIDARPNEADALKTAAAASFTEATKAYQAAADLLTARMKKPAGDAAAELSVDAEWLIRARCDQADMLLRTAKTKEAADLAWPLISDPVWTKSRSRQLATYHFAHASLLLKDYAAAVRELNLLAPFTQEFGVHARYLLGRAQHLSGERKTAAERYKAVLAGYEEQKKAAQVALQNPTALKAEQKASLEALVNQVPEHVGRAEFYSAVLAFDEGKLADAAAAFAAFAQKYPKSLLIPEAQFRTGVCNVQLKKYPEATAELDPLKEHPQLGDQALLWMARAKVAPADPTKPAEYDPALAAAMDMLRRSSQKVQALAATDADAKARRQDILMELADTAALAKLYPEAITNYEIIINEKLGRDEEAMQREVTAKHLATQYPEAEALATKFETTYPASTLLPLVIFRSAESAYLRAIKIADPAAQKVAFGEAVTRYKRIVRKYPEFVHINMARHGLASALYRSGSYTEAAMTFDSIPEADRTGELVTVPYLLADCLMRDLPPETDDATQAARGLQQVEQAMKLLEKFVAAQDKSPQGPDALLKLGNCHQRIAALKTVQTQRTVSLAAARDAYDRAIKLTDKEPTRSSAVFEMAKCQALLGDATAAAAALTQFQNAPFNTNLNAPLALLRLSVLLRAQGKAAEAVPVMANCRAQHEARLTAEPARAAWVPLIQYEHAVALKESGKLPEARAQFEVIAKQFPGKPEAQNAEWRVSQCKREEIAALLAPARTAFTKPDAKPEEIAAAQKLLDPQTDALRDSADAFLVQAEQLRTAAPGSDAHLRMLYEAAWCYRLLADVEGETERLNAQRAPAVGTPAPAPAPASRPPSEQRSVEIYKKIIAAAPVSPVTTQARNELSEIYSARGETDAAHELLTASVEKVAATEIPPRTRLGLAAASLVKKNPAVAMTHLQPLLTTPESPDGMEARALVGEVFMQQENWAKAIEQLLPFRDDEKFRNLASVSDRAVLRLGHAYAESAQWDASRQTFELLLQRYPQSPWFDEARYGIGWAWQSQKNYDNAVAAFSEVPKHTTTEIAAKAQLQIGLCRFEQKRFDEAVSALLVVPNTYNFPNWTAAARCAAARANIDLKKPTAAEALWRHVINDDPKSTWAEVARKGLEGLK